MRLKQKDLVDDLKQIIRIVSIACLAGGISAGGCFLVLSADIVQFLRESTVSEPGAGLAIVFFGIVSLMLGGFVGVVTSVFLLIRLYR